VIKIQEDEENSQHNNSITEKHSVIQEMTFHNINDGTLVDTDRFHPIRDSVFKS
jgi:hypothetical protein